MSENQDIVTAEIIEESNDLKVIPYEVTGYNDADEQQLVSPPLSKASVASLALGIIQVPLFFFGPAFAALAVIFGFIALNRSRRGIAYGRKAAIIGIILGIVGLVIFAGVLTFSIVNFNSSPYTH
jgi:hypothetical protein